jgi:hypothetical protein
MMIVQVTPPFGVSPESSTMPSLDVLLTLLEAPFMMLIVQALLTIVTIIIYDCNMFIVQATTLTCIKTFYGSNCLS